MKIKKITRNNTINPIYTYALIELLTTCVHTYKLDNKDNIKDLLTKQVYSPVRFRESVLKLKDLGVDTFIEIGPGKTLAGFIRRIDKDLKVINIEKIEDIDKLSDI